MITRFFALLVMCLIVSCGQDSKPDQKDIVESTNAINDDSNDIITDQERLKEEFEAQHYFIWEIDFDSKTITKNPVINKVNISVDSHIKG